jgi:putative transposase
LKVRGKNHRLACSIAEMNFFEFRRQLEYKAAMRGVVVMVADWCFASSKTCSACGSACSLSGARACSGVRYASRV